MSGQNTLDLFEAWLQKEFRICRLSLGNQGENYFAEHNIQQRMVQIVGALHMVKEMKASQTLTEAHSE